MKINRFVAMAAIALLAIGATGVISMQVLAKGSQSSACIQDQADDAEVASAEDTDKVELECGGQNEVDGAETVDAADTDNIQEASEEAQTPASP